MLYINRTLDSLMETALARLAQAGITETGPGGVARLLLSVVNQELAEDNPNGLYALLKANYAQAFLSTATGQGLDLKGAEYNLTRLPDETDDEFRYRISKAITAAEAGNETAIRMAAMSVPGVKDVIMRPFNMGPGSGSVYIVPTDYSKVDETIAAVREALKKVISHGSNIEVVSPELIFVKLHIQLIFKGSPLDSEKTSICNRVHTAIRNYLHSLAPGTSISVSQISSIVKDTSDLIHDFAVRSFKVNDRDALWVDQHTRWNQQFIESSAANAIRVTW